MGDYLKLKKSKCENCYKCIRHCPVKSIKFSNKQAHIVTDECILCGNCFVVCPQNAKEIRNDIESAKALIENNSNVYVSLAPSFIASFKGTTAITMSTALKKLGFAAVEETALGATVVKKEYERLVADESQNVFISSCCPTVNDMIQKYYPEAIPFLAPVMTPMQAHGKMIKDKEPSAKVVFIGPCISKKRESDEDGTYIDCVLTFEELTQWLDDEKIAIESGEGKIEKSKARLFPTTGGILKTMVTDSPKYTYMAVDGVENCISVISDIMNGSMDNCFIEMSACLGSCVGGPAMNAGTRAPVRDYISVNSFAGKEDFAVPEISAVKDYKYIGLNKQMPGQADIDQILQKMGKTKPEDELNCSACGYNTCREKAIAVYQGKAEISMCLPFLKDKAESFSDTIISNTPNGIIVLNEALEVQQINTAARNILNIRSASDILGDQVIRILDPKVFLDVMESGRGVKDERIYLAEYHKYVEQSVVYDQSYHILMCIMRDVTDEEREKSKKELISKHTIEVTDRVIEKQMRVVQEIASLLGETTAETKIALTNLKDSLNDE